MYQAVQQTLSDLVRFVNQVLSGFDLAPPGAIWYYLISDTLFRKFVLISLPPEQFGIVALAGSHKVSEF